MSNTKNIFRVIVFLTFCHTLVSCAGPTVTFQLKGEARVELVEPDKLELSGEDLGKTPITIANERLVGKVVKIFRAGTKPMFWYFVADDADETNIQIDISDDSVFGKLDAEAPGLANFTHRMLLKSYKALADKRYKEAIEISKSITSVSPGIAAPYIVQGLALAASGDTVNARSVLARARELDPEDTDIRRLLQSIN